MKKVLLVLGGLVLVVAVLIGIAISWFVASYDEAVENFGVDPKIKRQGEELGKGIVSQFTPEYEGRASVYSEGVVTLGLTTREEKTPEELISTIHQLEDATQESLPAHWSAKTTVKARVKGRIITIEETDTDFARDALTAVSDLPPWIYRARILSKDHHLTLDDESTGDSSPIVTPQQCADRARELLQHEAMLTTIPTLTLILDSCIWDGSPSRLPTSEPPSFFISAQPSSFRKQVADTASLISRADPRIPLDAASYPDGTLKVRFSKRPEDPTQKERIKAAWPGKVVFDKGSIKHDHYPLDLG